MIQFYAPDIERTLRLPADESAHCVRVLRMREGDEIRVTDGRGGLFRCRILDADPKGVPVEILGSEATGPQWPFRVVLAVAPTKNADRMEWLVEKAVEIGVDEIVLLECRHSVRRKMGTQRLNRIAVSAMNQSLKTYLPAISGLTPIADFIARPSEAQKFFGYCDDSFPRCDFASACRPATDTVVMIGPEGDFSAEEVDAAVKAGFRPVTFGTQRLRTETAALYGLQGVHILNSISKNK